MDMLFTYLEGSLGLLIMVGATWLSYFILFVATLWMAAIAVKKSIGWGLFVFFIPFIGPICFARNEPTLARRSFRIYLLGIGLLALGITVFILRALIATFFVATPV